MNLRRNRDRDCDAFLPRCYLGKRKLGSPPTKQPAELASPVATNNRSPLPPTLAVADAPTKNLDERYGSIYCSSDPKNFLGSGGGLAHKFGLPPAVMRIALIFIPFGPVADIAALFLPKLPTKGVPKPA
jgi:phage shock protein PspC (stress-responsive transcriptional regulator)